MIIINKHTIFNAYQWFLWMNILMWICEDTVLINENSSESFIGLLKYFRCYDTNFKWLRVTKFTTRNKVESFVLFMLWIMFSNLLQHLHRLCKNNRHNIVHNSLLRSCSRHVNACICGQNSLCLAFIGNATNQTPTKISLSIIDSKLDFLFTKHIVNWI